MSASTWVWEGNELIDAPSGEVLASVRSDVLHIGDERILIEHSAAAPMTRFWARATTSSGQVLTIAQDGLTVAQLRARCADRDYTLVRTSLWRTQRVVRDGQGREVAHVRPLISGRVEFIAEHPRLLDAVFLSWGCVLVDAPVRRPRI
ncbi:hypothetical protein [Corynebacterium sp. Marseille-Q2516]